MVWVVRVVVMRQAVRRHRNVDGSECRRGLYVVVGGISFAHVVVVISVIVVVVIIATGS